MVVQILKDSKHNKYKILLSKDNKYLQNLNIELLIIKMKKMNKYNIDKINICICINKYLFIYILFLSNFFFLKIF